MPLALPPPVSAQDDGAASASGFAARIDAIGGDVAIQRGDDNEPLAAVTNAPVIAGDYVTTGAQSRAEVGFDGRSAVRLGENVQMRFVGVDPANRQVQLAAGAIDLRLFGDTDGQSTIDTPSISVVPRTAGSYRVEVDANGETAVTVRAGRADIVTPQGNQSLQPGTTLIADGPAANPAIHVQPALALDDFDSYNGDRDRIYVAATASSQYVNTNVAGIGDLNGNGHWVADGTYGNVWIPTAVAANWAPYRNGNWVWEGAFGWTWVAAEPWGWAPFHYGRWYFSTAYQRWAWYPPPPARIAPAWSPALVGFVGFNIGAVNVGVGFGNIGWVPLAPYEAVHAAQYRNIQVNGALTAVTRANFQNGRFGTATVVTTEQLRSLHPVAVQGALPLAPTRANLRFTQHAPLPSLAVRPQMMNAAFAGRSFSQASYAQPQYRRPLAPAYARPPAQYYHPASPSYARPQYVHPAARPQPHATHNRDEHRDR
ncbi:MAG TPA: DUF6600 domain-containing protein [Candidatus Lustribacter sp.]|nr:DUF6600 domain-containing protein [Candidatus Lustribacter sp.]